MTTSHRIIVTIEPDDNPADAGTSSSGLLVEADPNPLLAEGEYRHGEQVSWDFVGLTDCQLPLVVFFNEEDPETADDPRGPFETLSMSKQRIVGCGYNGYTRPALLYNVFIIDPSSRGASLLKPRWKNPDPDLRFGGLEPPRKPP